MATSALSLATKDQAKSTLASGISPSATSIAVASSDGSKFPQPYNGTATSLGTNITLNCTGISVTIGGSAQVGKFIHNTTDGSGAFITAVSANSLTTTPLFGGVGNIWHNSDAWRIDEFVVTLAKQTTSASGVITDTQIEEALIIARSTDTLTVAIGGRGYNGTTAGTFATADVVQLRATSPVHEGLRYLIYETANALNNSVNSILNASSFYATDTGSLNAFAASFPNVQGSLAAGMIFFVKAAAANTGSATLTVTLNGTAQTAKTIKKLDGATNLSANDIASGQIFHVEYDGTNFQLHSPVANAPVTIGSVGFYGTGATGSVTWSVDTNLDPTLIYNYVNATLNSGKVLSVSSVNTPLIINSTGNVDIEGTIDLNGKGGAGGTAPAINIAGNSGTSGHSLLSGFTAGNGTGGTPAGGSGTGGTAGSSSTSHAAAFLATFNRYVTCGGGGGSGASATTGTGTGGAGGAGGGSLVWYIAGNLTLGASSIIRCNGVTGTAGAAGGANPGGGGGGGGGGGMVVIVVAGTITNNGVTVSTSAGSGGAAGSGTGNAGAGGGGGASGQNGASAGSNGGGNGGVGTGGAGANGNVVIYSLTDNTVILAS